MLDEKTIQAMIAQAQVGASSDKIILNSEIYKYIMEYHRTFDHVISRFINILYRLDLSDEEPPFIEEYKKGKTRRLLKCKAGDKEFNVTLFK